MDEKGHVTGCATMVGVAEELPVVRLLGTVSIVHPTGWRDVGRPRQRAVLAALALNAGKVLPRTSLLRAVWGDDPPRSSAGNLHTYVFGLRRLLDDRPGEPSVLRTEANGYRLAIPAEHVDALEFDRLTQQTAACWEGGDITGCLASSAEAANLWRGTPLTGVEGPAAAAERIRLETGLLVLQLTRARALLATGRADDAVATCTRLVHDHPLNEQVVELLSRSLYRSGRVAEGLDELNKIRKRLRDELGERPCTELAMLYQQMLAGELDDDGTAAEGRSTGSPPAPTVVSSHRDPAGEGVCGPPAQLPHRPWHFLGRSAELAELDRSPESPVLISGHAGIGKSALALAFSHRVAPAYPDGQLYLNLGGSGPGDAMSGSGALHHLLRSLGTRQDELPSTVRGLVEKLRAVTRKHRVLVLLDDVADEQQVAPLLSGCGAAALVVLTSRYRLSGAAVTKRIRLGGLDRAASAELLRGDGTTPDFAPDHPATGRLVKLCGGVPLALRVAAMRLSSAYGMPDAGSTVTGLLGKLEDQQGRVAELSMDDGPVSLRAGLARTCRALPSGAVCLLGDLGRHGADEVDLAAIGWPAERARHALAALVEACLLDETEHAYRLPPMIRDYAVSLTQPGG